MFIGHQSDVWNYHRQLRKIHASTFGDFEMYDDCHEEKEHKQETIPKSKTWQFTCLMETKCKTSLSRCQSLPLNLLINPRYYSLSPSDPLAPKQDSDVDSCFSMSTFKGNENDNQIAVSAQDGKDNRLNKFFKNGVKNHLVVKSVRQSPTNSSQGKQRKGYFYESVGGVYYAVGSSGCDDKSELKKDKICDMLQLSNACLRTQVECQNQVNI